MTHDAPEQTAEYGESDSDLDDVARCEQLIGYTFRNKELLAEALTHASGANTRLRSNERLEFLGDSVLGFLVCHHLYDRCPDLLEGDMTKIKSIVVSGQTCGQWAEQLHLRSVLRVGKGMGRRGSVPASLMSDMFESIVGAIFLDGGLTAIESWLAPLISERVQDIRTSEEKQDYKSALQQWAQKHYGVPPTYFVLEERGPDHAKSFYIAAQLGNRQFTPAWGRTKKEAEQSAARAALTELAENSDLG